MSKTNMALSPGSRLGPYEILAPLGAGGMGEVYRARDPRLDREVAIKVLPEHLARDPEALARFQREARAVAALSHPNILAIHDFGEDQGVHYAVTELLEGENLRQRLEASGTLPWRRAAEIAAAVGDGLSDAHAKGIIHRDLKPENLFLISDGRVKILDFGLARIKPPATTMPGSSTPTESDPGRVMGTVGYMSPEQLRGLPAEAPSDIFSLGCVLYEMVTGRQAFVRRTGPETIAAILKEDPPPLPQARGPLPADLERILTRCLEKGPGERFQSARDLSFALRSAGSGGGSLAAVPARRRNRWMAGAAAGIAVAAAALWLSGRRPGADALDSIAVLPFAAAGHPDAEYLGDGIAESIINDLSQLGRIRVIARATAFRYKGREPDLAQIGGQLNVRVLLTGRVTQRGDRVTVQADLVDAATGAQLWGRRYERPLAGVAAVEEEVARDIVQQLRTPLTGEQLLRLSRRRTADPEAYQLYIKGRFHWNQRSPEGLDKAVGYFEQAVRKDPRYALAWVGLADAHNLRSLYAGEPPRQAFPKAEAALEQALRIEEGLGEAHAALANLRSLYHWDWPGAEREFRRAIELSPGYATAHHSYAFFLTAMGRHQEALAEIRRAQHLDPLSLIISAAVSRILYGGRRFEEAIQQARQTLQMDPNFVQAHLLLGDCYLLQGLFPQALESYQRAMTLAGGPPENTPELVHAWTLAGRRDDARRILEQWTLPAPPKPVVPYDVALVYAGLRDNNRAMEWLEKAYQERSDSLVWFT